MSYISPKFRLDAFNCPHCGAFAKHNWHNMLYRKSNGYVELNNYQISYCQHCELESVWKDEILLYPDSVNVPLPNPDMPDDIKLDYIEASRILSRSTKGAAAILRLAIQKLCKILGEKGENINHDIGELVKKGLPLRIQQSLDVLRVVGNNAVHPGQLNLDDNMELTEPLFSLINLIVDVTVTQPKHVNELYNKLPTSLLEAIEKRDKNSLGGSHKH